MKFETKIRIVYILFVLVVIIAEIWLLTFPAEGDITREFEEVYGWELDHAYKLCDQHIDILYVGSVHNYVKCADGNVYSLDINLQNGDPL